MLEYSISLKRRKAMPETAIEPRLQAFDGQEIVPYPACRHHPKGLVWLTTSGVCGWVGYTGRARTQVSSWFQVPGTDILPAESLLSAGTDLYGNALWPSCPDRLLYGSRSPGQIQHRSAANTNYEAIWGLRMLETEAAPDANHCISHIHS